MVRVRHSLGNVLVCVSFFPSLSLSLSLSVVHPPTRARGHVCVDEGGRRGAYLEYVPVT